MARKAHKLRKLPDTVAQQLQMPIALIQWLHDVIVNMSGTAGNIPKYEAAGVGFENGYAFKDEDNMASNSATAVASQQSIKAYVDAVMADHIATYHP